MNNRTIKQTFRKGGFDYSLLKRKGSIVMYSQTVGNYLAFEVMRVHTETVDKRFHNAGDEYLPSTNEWGTRGWTYTNREDADRKFIELVEKYEKEGG